MNGEDRNEGGDRIGSRSTATIWTVALVVLFLAIGGILLGRGRLARPAPVRPRPAPTRPAPTVPSPTPSDLKRYIDRVKAAVDKNDWTRARDEVTALRRTWTAYRGKVGNLVKSADLTAFESRVDKLVADVRLKNKAMVDKDLSDLRRLADKFEAARTKSPPPTP